MYPTIDKWVKRQKMATQEVTIQYIRFIAMYCNIRKKLLRKANSLNVDCHDQREYLKLATIYNPHSYINCLFVIYCLQMC